jgi:hypothetical protein
VSEIVKRKEEYLMSKTVAEVAADAALDELMESLGIFFVDDSLGVSNFAILSARMRDWIRKYGIDQKTGRKVFETYWKIYVRRGWREVPASVVGTIALLPEASYISWMHLI